MRRRSGRVAGIVPALVAVAIAFAAHLAGLFADAEQYTVAERYELRTTDVPRDIALVTIDGRTFDQLRRQWPFPRSMHGRVIRALDRAGARQVVFDVQVSEPSADPQEDFALFESIRRTGGVVLAGTEFDTDGSHAVLGGEANVRAANAEVGAANLPESEAGMLDHFLQTFSGRESMAALSARMAGSPAPDAGFEDGRAWIDFRGPPGTMPSISYADVLKGTFDPARVRGRVVVIGATAASLQDFHTTPTSALPMAGAEIQANAIWTALHGVPLRSAPLIVNVLCVLLLGCAGPLLRARLRVVAAAAATLAVALAYVAAAQIAFVHGSVIWVVAPLVALITGTVTMIVASHAAESRERRRVAHDNDLLEGRVRERTRELRETQLEILQRLAGAAEWRDEDTGAHVDRIGTLSHRLALAAGLSEEDAEMILHASTAHDIGKVGIPDAILLKPGGLTAAERRTMQGHAAIGASMLAGSSAPLLQLAEQIARTHHERWDGSGYPSGLRGEQIPLAGRICAVVDVFDALVSRRPYKRAWTLDEAIAELRAQRGRDFDPVLVDAFLSLAPAAYDELYGAFAAEPAPAVDVTPAGDPAPPHRTVPAHLAGAPRPPAASAPPPAAGAPGTPDPEPV